MEAPDKIKALVERFSYNLEAYKKGNYKEYQLRKEFIDPFFECLGWDMENKQGYAEAYKDVQHEASIKVGGATKAPDYCFTINGVRKFFVEAKKPSINIKEDIHPAFQLRRYAWSSKLPLSILTDFEEFAVYDCRQQPNKKDKVSHSRVLYMKYTEYLDRWDEIYGVFAKESILKGSFDKYVESNKAKKGTAEVDDVFLQEIERWRELLARNIAIRNPALSQRELNYAVQQTIDRIIFLRICEDRGIERDGRLMALCNGHNVYERLFELFRKADEKYNSGLFHFRKEKGRENYDRLTPQLQIDDKVLKDVFKNLYYPDSPYEFSVIPTEILGQVYEQFLGKVIYLTPSNRAKIEEKPEVRKAGGVYYTPTYIVNYIVKGTVGKLVEGKRPGPKGGVSKIKILDPACGSGSFLIGAYQFLLDWHRDQYIKDDPEKWTKGRTPRLYQSKSGGWRLTTEERKRILINNIYGVDVDPQAVEVTKLSLLLKVLEGEDEESIGKQLSLFQERILPDLGNNIKCGNSLIGPDLYRQHLEFSEEDIYSVNAFDWNNEFPEIMKDGGFDAVIGNPPYIDSEWMTKYLPLTRSYCNKIYLSATGNWDIFCVFIEKAISLCRHRGLTSMIVPNKLGAAAYAAGARAMISSENTLISIRDYSHVPVFPVSVYPIIYLSQKSEPKNKAVHYERMKNTSNNEKIIKTEQLDYKKYFSSSRTGWPIFSDINENGPVERMQSQFPPLESLASVFGAATVSEAYEIQSLIHECPDERNLGFKVINSGTIDRYNSLWGHKKLRYIGSAYHHPCIPEDKKKYLPKKRREQAEYQKIIVAGMTKHLECMIDDKGDILAGKSTSIIFSPYNLLYLLGILNSSLIDYYFKSVFGGNKMQGGYLNIGPPQLRSIPIRALNVDIKTERDLQTEMESMVKRIIALHEKLNTTSTPNDKLMIQRQIKAVDDQINHFVYRLYSLTEEEIELIESEREKG
ncbi:MAG: N-6 DNA methylase [Bacteroidales bacterium]|nr:N-6 DNA methylase [Bacteroidales bacterium]